MDSISGESRQKPSVEEAGAKGGKAAAARMTPEEREERARKAAAARWSADLPQAHHEGILRLGDAEIQCYVLGDGERIISTRGVMKALGRSWRGRKYAGTELPVFLEAKNLKPFIKEELAAVLSMMEFKTTSGLRAEGFKAKLLPLLCSTYLDARDAGVLTASQKRVAGMADILLRGMAHVGIIALVDEATGYQDHRAHNALAKILEEFVAKELRKWVRTFPPEFYKEMFRLRNMEYSGRARGLRYIGHLTNDVVYSRLAPGVLAELRNKNPVTESGCRKNKHHQWLTEHTGHPKLVQHLDKLTDMMKMFDTWNEFMRRLDRALPKYQEMPLLEWAEKANAKKATGVEKCEQKD